MNEAALPGTLTLLEYWHAGSGLPGAGDVDDTPVRDRFLLPYLPGKSLKGLFQEACCELAAWAAVPNDSRPTLEELSRWFGEEGNDGAISEGLLIFPNAALKPHLATHLTADRMQDALFEVLSATAIEECGVARERSLRRFEVAVPLELYFQIMIQPVPAPPEHKKIGSVLTTAARLIRRVGKHRNNGLGRCTVRINTIHPTEPQTPS